MRDLTEQLMVFPARGIMVLSPRFAQQPGTCVDCLNVRAFDVEEDRARGGSRPGLSKYCSQQLDSARIQNINYSVTMTNTSPNTAWLFSREVHAAAVCNGFVYEFNTTTATKASQAGSWSLSNTAPVIYSAELFGDLYYCDGLSYRKWDSSTNAESDWTASTDGTLPGDPPNTAARLITMWRSRIVLSGLVTDPHNWFMSRLGDPLDWEYAPNTTTETQPVQGGLGFAGKIGDKVTALIPYSDDILLIGCDHTIWQMSGDPQAGGRVDLVSSEIGIAWGEAWTISPEGSLYFMSNKASVWQLQPGDGPKELSAMTVSPLIENTNLNTSSVKLSWDTEHDGIHMWITPLTAGSATHWFFDGRTQGWFKDIYASTNHNPVTAKVFDGDSNNDRVVMIGSEDGYIRKIDDSAYQDDGTGFESSVTMGPLFSKEGHKPVVLKELQAVTDVNSDTIKFEVVGGDTPDEAINSFDGTFTGSGGSWSAGLGTTHNPRQRGYYVYVKVGQNASAKSWALEYIRTTHSTVSSSKGRQATN